MTILSILALAAACGGTGQGPASPAAPPAVASEVVVTVDPLRTRQTIEDVAGGNFIHTFSRVTTGLDPIGRYNFEGLAPRQVRLRMALEGWEPENDNADASRAAAGGFRDDGFNHGAFLLAQEAAGRGAELTASIWDVPGWLVSNPASERNRKIPPELYPELAESIGEWLRTSRDVYGAPVAFVSFNEADIGVNVSLTPTEHAALVAEIGPRLAARGLHVKWLLGDCSNMASCVGYSRPIWDNPAARPHLGVFAFHTWDSSAPDAALAGLYEFGRSTGLPIRATEGGWDPFLWQRSAEFPSWTNALRLATVYTRVLKHSGASSLLYWQMLGRDYNINDGAAGFPAWQVLRALRQEIVPGSQVVETTADRGLLHSVAVRDGADLVLVLVNGGVADQPVRVEGLPQGAYRRFQATARGVESSPAGPVSGALVLPRESVTIFASRP